jgi:hypothetical protein
MLASVAAVSTAAQAAPPPPAPTPNGQAELNIMSRDATRLNDIVYAAQTVTQPPTSSKLTIKLMVNCYGTNLRVVQNAMSPNSYVQFEASFAGKPVAVAFPARFTDKTNSMDIALLSEIKVVNPANVIGSPDISRNTIRITTQNIDVTSFAAPNAAGDYSAASRNAAIDYMNFKQDVYLGGFASNHPDGWLSDQTPGADAPKKSSIASTWFSGIGRLLARMMPTGSAFAGGGDGGADGGGPVTPGADPTNADGGFFGSASGAQPAPIHQQTLAQGTNWAGADSHLSSTFTTAWSSDMTLLEIHAAFPGQVGFCGGFRSPLMLFFDEKRPTFDGHVKFKMTPTNDETNWVSAGDPGYFLALDNNSDGLINDASELFGDFYGASNGFEDLRSLDANHDGVIDAQDPVFERLLLWRDLNGDGISQPGELFTLRQMGVESISLGYSTTAPRTIGAKASFRQRSAFKFTDSHHRSKTGEVIDVWLSNETH